MPVDNLLSNWAYMVMASLAWTLKAWFALMLPETGRWRERYRQQKTAVLKMEFRTFLNAFMRVPAQVIRQGRRIVLTGLEPVARGVSPRLRPTPRQAQLLRRQLQCRDREARSTHPPNHEGNGQDDDSTATANGGSRRNGAPLPYAGASGAATIALL